MNFCTKCGSQIEAGVQFCTRCGAPLEAVTQSGAVHLPTEPTTTALAQSSAASPAHFTPLRTPQPDVTKAKSGCMPTALVVMGILAVLAALGIGGLVYAGYKVKQEATALLHNNAPDTSTPAAQPAVSPGDIKRGSPSANPSGNPAALLDGLANMLGGDDDGDHVESISDTAPVEPCQAAPLPSQSAARIPLLPGTVITTEWGVKYGDVEGRASINSTTSGSVEMEVKSEAYKDDNGREQTASINRNTVCNADLVSADTYVTVNFEHMPHLIHGVTRLRLSSKSFEEAKSSGRLTLRYLGILTKGDDVKPTYEEGVLARVEPEDVAYPMIVNDQPVTLPAIHLAGIMKSAGRDPTPKKYRPLHTQADFYVIDDPLDPLVLMMKLKDSALHDGKFRVEVVKIDFQTPHPVNMVEKQLAEQKHAITYGIYFDFNKDTIKPESEPVLRQIVQAMTDHPSWKLTVNGDTDNIGGDAYNLDLSKRRAAAVKQALVIRYHIVPDRLTTNGYGAASPIDTNDTLRGRARNRRVELTRE